MADLIIQADKLLPYLLHADHPDGGPKAALFFRFGFSAGSEGAVGLAKALHSHAQLSAKREIVAGRFGPKLVAEGLLQTPSRRSPHCISVWAHDAANDSYRLITAYICEP